MTLNDKMIKNFSKMLAKAIIEREWRYSNSNIEAIIKYFSANFNTGDFYYNGMKKSAKKYVETRLKSMNGTCDIKKIIELYLNTRIQQATRKLFP